MAKNTECPTERTLALISGRWKVMIIYWLLKGERRFNQLQRDLQGITHRTLAKQLREMGTDGWWNDWISRKFRRAWNIAFPREDAPSSPF